MKHIKFKVERDTIEGAAGIMPLMFKNWENYNPSYGATLAHDILEHGSTDNDQRGHVWQEIKAMGALCHVRNFARAQNVRPEDSGRANGSQLVELNFSESVSLDLPSVPRHRLDASERDEFENFFSGLQNGIKASLQYIGDEAAEVAEDFFLGNFEQVKLLTIDGYFRAKKIFKDEYVFHTFQTIDKVTQKAMSELETYLDSDLEFLLSFDHEGNAVIKNCAFDDYEHYSAGSLVWVRA